MKIQNSIIAAVFMTAAGIAVAAVAPPTQTISTELNEVRAGNIDGVDYLDLHIDRRVGPITCRNDVVSVDIDQYGENSESDIQVLALQAMVKSEPVLITVQLEENDCIDGKPLVSELVVLHKNSLF